MAEEAVSQNYPSIPSNYISVAQLQEKWLKEKEKEKQENQEKEHPRNPVRHNHQRHQNHIGKSWREVGLIYKEPKLKEVKINAQVVEEGEKNKKKNYFGKRVIFVRDMAVVSVENSETESSKGKCKRNSENEEVYKITAPVVEEGFDGTSEKIKKKNCYFGKRKPRFERDGKRDMAKEEIMAVVSVENGGKESFKGKCKWNSENKEVEEAANVCTVEVVEENKVDREIAGQIRRVGFRGNKNSWRKMGDRVGEVSDIADSVEQSGKYNNAEKEEFYVDVKERTNEKVKMRGAYGDKEVEVVGESNVDREIGREKWRDGFRGKENGGRKTGDRVGEVSDKVDSVEHSGKEHNEEKEKVSVDVKERTNEKVRMRGAFRAYSGKGVEESVNVCTVEVVGENEVDREITGQSSRVGFRGKKNSGRRMGVRVGEVSDKVDSVEQSGQERNAENEEVSVDVKERTHEKVRMRGSFCGYRDKEVEEVTTICTVEVVGENKVDREIVGQKSRVGFKGKKNSRGRTGNRVGEVSDKVDSVEQSGQNPNAEKEKVSVDVKERTNEKVRMRGAFCGYGDKEVEDVATICTVEVVGENEVDREIAGKKCKVGFRGKKNRVGEVSDKEDKADGAEQSGKEHNAEKEKVLVDVKERTNEKVRVRGAFRAYGDKNKDVPLINSEVGLKMKIEKNLGDLSLSDRTYGHGRSRRYELRKMLKQRVNSFVWVKKGESSNSNVAENETQVDFSSQSTSRSKLCSQ